MRVNDRGTNGEERADIQTADAKFGSLKLVSAPEIEAGELAVYNFIWDNSMASSLYIHDGLWPSGKRVDPDWRPTDFSDMKAPSGFEYVKHR